LTEFARRKLGRAIGYGWAGLLGDLSGGVIAALIALPYGLAMASLMGLPPVLGVFTSILTAVPLLASLSLFLVTFFRHGLPSNEALGVDGADEPACGVGGVIVVDEIAGEAVAVGK